METALGLIVLVLLFAAARSAWKRKFGTAALYASIILGMSVVGTIFGPADTATATKVEPSTPSDILSVSKETVWIRANQRLVAAKLKDPVSASFENEFVSYKTGAPVVCGSVNAKNSFGAYSGAQRYIGAGEAIGVYLADEVSGFDDLWKKLCR